MNKQHSQRVSRASEALESGPDLNEMVIVGNLEQEDGDSQSGPEGDAPASSSASVASASHVPVDDAGFEHVVIDGRESGAASTSSNSNGSGGGDGGGARTKKNRFTKPTLFRSPQETLQECFRAILLAPSATLKSKCIRGKLAGNQHCRPAAWSLCLDLLPPNLSEWVGLVKSRRERYDILKRGYMADERNSGAIDPEVNNPLSQDGRSPWNKFFKDNELWMDIWRDVERTNPGNPLFKKDAIKDMMANILFIYGKKYPAMSYKQGMHECVAVLICAQCDCCREFNRVMNPSPTEADEASSTNNNAEYNNANPDLGTTMRVISDRRFVEADCFFLFEKFMEKMWEWYYVSSPVRQGEMAASLSAPILLQPSPTSPIATAIITERRPFENGGSRGNCSQDDPSLSSAARKLQHLWVNILQLHDPVLFAHLQQMCILPTTFGTNWTKLLFSRQVPEYLRIWDAVIATNFSIVECLVVAMIIGIRSLLLEGDCIKCNMLLVSKYPTSIDVKFLIAKALRLYDPLQYPQPSISPFKFGIPYLFTPLQEIRRRRSKTGDYNENGGVIVSNGDASIGGSNSNSSSSGFRLTARVTEGIAVSSPNVVRKMVNFSGPREVKVGDDGQFEFLGGEPSCALGFRELKEEVLAWRGRLGVGLGLLRRATSDDETASAVGVIEAVVQSMGQMVREGSAGAVRNCASLPSVAMDALEIENNGDVDDEEDEEDEEEDGDEDLTSSNASKMMTRPVSEG